MGAARRSVAPVALAALAGCMQIACDRNQDQRALPPEPAPVEQLARAVGADAAAISAPIDPPRPAGDLHDDVASFTTLDKCAADHASIDPLVGDALSSIGYDTFLRDACRVLEATKAGDKRKCAAIESSGLAARCETLVAMTKGDADGCPLTIAHEPSRGRDATCVAVALHDARLCAGAEGDDAVTCVALVARDTKGCASARFEPARRACTREVTRLRTSLAEAQSGLLPLEKPSAKLTLAAAPGSSDPPRATQALDDDVAHGVVVVRDSLGVRLRVGSLDELGAVPHAVEPASAARIGFELVVPSGAGGKGAAGSASAARLDHAEIDIPGGTALSSESLVRSLHLTVDKLEPTRGGSVHLHIEGDVGFAPHAVKLRLELQTFVRDVVGASAAATPR